jgi:hypothetical protein
MAPEVLDGVGYDERYSAWQFGLVVTQVVCGTTVDLFDCGPTEWPVRAIKCIEYTLPLPTQDEEAVHPSAIDLIQNHLLVPQNRRCTVAKALTHNYFHTALL